MKINEFEVKVDSTNAVKRINELNAAISKLAEQIASLTDIKIEISIVEKQPNNRFYNFFKQFKCSKLISKLLRIKK